MNRRGQTLAALLIVILIIGVLAVGVLYGRNMFGPKESPRPDKLGNSTPVLAKLTAEDAVCKSNLNQVRQAIQMQRMSSDELPSFLEDLKLGTTLTTCPVGGERYSYDSLGGTVSCPHRGHEGY